jgi:copper oxidase (laccase) domain-containing protein
MIDAFGEETREFIRPVGDKYYVNLKEINALSLRRAGVRQIEVSCECTKCRPDRFWSHRITGLKRGSQGAIILCKEETK